MLVLLILVVFDSGNDTIAPRYTGPTALRNANAHTPRANSSSANVSTALANLTRAKKGAARTRQ